MKFLRHITGGVVTATILILVAVLAFPLFVYDAASGNQKMARYPFNLDYWFWQKGFWG